MRGMRFTMFSRKQIVAQTSLGMLQRFCTIQNWVALVSRNVSTTVHRVVEGSTSGQKQILCAHIEVLATSNAHITQTSITQPNGIPCIFVGNTIFTITTGVYHEEDFILSFCYTMSVFAALLSIRQ